jgi:hypothetical protein
VATPPKPSAAKATMAHYIADLKKLRAERDRLIDLPTSDKTRGPALRKLYEERGRLLAPLGPLFHELIEGGAIDVQYERDPSKADDAYLLFDVHDHEVDKHNGSVTLLSYGIGESSDPPPALETEDGENIQRVLENEGEVFRVPVTSHLIVADRVDHEDHTHKSVRQVALLADDFYSSDQGNAEVIGVQPSTRRVDAVFGIIADDLAPSDVSIMSLDALLQREQIILLGYEYDGERRQWLPELDILRDVMSHDREPGVVIDGKFRRLPRLDLSPSSGEDESTPPA